MNLLRTQLTEDQRAVIAVEWDSLGYAVPDGFLDSLKKVSPCWAVVSANSFRGIQRGGFMMSASPLFPSFAL